jgi:hypothetical protein
MGFFKNFMMKQALKAKMKDVPEAERERLLSVMEKNPDFFNKIGEEVKQLTKQGQSEMAATMIVMRKHQAELQKLMLDSQ